ncbi:uncharacterized protein EMH_0027240 [Eimeria mitis]|uniref:Transmembrane protein n=1 Tax=Eimeria mitis TaxID=44415 RepID=U6JXQ2_9EIME|nr:uncharacterized protein EMH_0027240 [Eimeria mitis]CDJ30204.1 hypothetical protein, conserved [Eimeria mitis]
MSTRKRHRSQKTQRRPPILTHGDEMASSNISDTQVLADTTPAEKAAEERAVPSFLSAYFVQNYITSMAFHAYIAFAPTLLLPILKQTSLFSKWSSNAMVTLGVFLSNASWMELFNFNCTGDAGSAFIVAVQEKRFLEARGYSLAPATKRMWLLGGISGFLGAITVGLLTAAFSGLNPFGDTLPLPQEIFRLVRETKNEEPSILEDLMDATMTARQKTVAVAFIRTVAISVVGSCPPMLVPLLLGLQNQLQSSTSYEVFRAISVLFDTFVAEFLCCFVVYAVSAVFTSAGFYLKLRHAQRLNLAVLLFAVIAGLPFCTVVGGPMLGISFAGLVAGSRLDPWCFVLMASADFLAALSAIFCVRPVQHAFFSVPASNIKKRV